MTNWRFCGRFSDIKQNATRRPEDTWFSEEEAKRRYHNPSKELTIVPPVDPTMGIVPYYITVTTAERPSFVATIQQPPGVMRIQLWWKNVGDGRLFCDSVIRQAWPPVEQIFGPGDLNWDIRGLYENREDGTGTMELVFRGEERTISAKRKDIPVDKLYLPVPAWGAWDTLANGPRPEEFENDAASGGTAS